MKVDCCMGCVCMCSACAAAGVCLFGLTLWKHLTRVSGCNATVYCAGQLGFMCFMC